MDKKRQESKEIIMSKTFIPYAYLDDVASEGMKRNFNIGAAIYINSHIGLRYNELKMLKFEDLKPKFTIFVSKQKKNRNIVLPIKIKKFLSDYRHLYVPEDYIVRTRKKNRPMSIQNFNDQLKHVVMDSKIPVEITDIASHTLRKTFGRAFWEANDSSYTALMLLQKIYGHKDPGTTTIYIGIQQMEIETAINKM